MSSNTNIYNHLNILSQKISKLLISDLNSENIFKINFIIQEEIEKKITFYKTQLKIVEGHMGNPFSQSTFAR